MRKLENLIPGLLPSESEAKRDMQLTQQETRHAFVAVDKVLPAQQHAMTFITCFGRPEVPIASIGS